MIPRHSLRLGEARTVSLAACASIVLWAGSALAQSSASSDIRTVLDLKYTVQDLGGKVQDLQIKETDTEIRIELAADVLFDFDKADLRPVAQQTLHQAAGIIQEKARGAVRIDGHTDSKGNDAYNQ